MRPVAIAFDCDAFGRPSCPPNDRDAQIALKLRGMYASMEPASSTKNPTHLPPQLVETNKDRERRARALTRRVLPFCCIFIRNRFFNFDTFPAHFFKLSIPFFGSIKGAGLISFTALIVIERVFHPILHSRFSFARKEFDVSQRFFKFLCISTQSVDTATRSAQKAGRTQKEARRQFVTSTCLLAG